MGKGIRRWWKACALGIILGVPVGIFLEITRRRYGAYRSELLAKEFESQGMSPPLMVDQTGKEYWRARIGGNHSASPNYADGRIYFLSEEGGIGGVGAGSAAETPRDKSTRWSHPGIDGRRGRFNFYSQRNPPLSHRQLRQGHRALSS